MTLVARRVLTLALCLVLIMQILTFIPASAVTVKNNFEGEWTATLEGDRTWVNEADDHEHYIIGGEIRFTADEYGRLDGEGTLWIEYTVLFTLDQFGTCTYEGRRDNLAFDVGGEYDKETGKATLMIDPPYFVDMDATYTPGEQYSDALCPGENGYTISPYQNFNSRQFQSFDLVDGAVHDQRFNGYGESGPNRITLHSPIVEEVECPSLTITPTMPPASDPRNLAGPSDTASYRFQVAWDGMTPVSVNFDVQGGSDSVNPNFVFNPANMESSPISVLMDVATDGAEEGEYPLTVDAWVVDPDTGEECHAEQTATVTLVVGESRATDLPIVKRVGQVEITPEETDTGGQNVIIETGNDGAVTFISAGDETSDDTHSVTTIDVGSNTAIKGYGQVDYFAKILEDKAEDAELLAMTDEELLEFQHDIMKGKGPTEIEILKNAIKDFLEGYWVDLKFDVVKKFACLFPSGDSNIADVCSGKSLFYIWEGDVHIVDKSTTKQLIDRVNSEAFDPGIFMTDNSMIIPTGTELTINVQQSDLLTITTVTLLEGSALVVDLASAKTHLVNAGEKYYLETSFAGESASSTDKKESVSSDSVSRWWQVANIQVGDFATAKDIETGDEGSEPVGRSSVFSDVDELVWAWVEFLNVPARVEHVIDFKWYAPDGSLYESNDFTMIDAEAYESWPSYGAFDVIGIWRVDAAEKFGHWKVEVYYDGDFVKEIPFYMAKNTLIEDQSVTYALEANVISDNRETESYFENGFALGIAGGFAGAENINGIDDIEWLKTTVIDNSEVVGAGKDAGRIQDTLKLKGQASIDAEPWSLSDASLSSFIPTIGIDEDFTIPTGFGDPFPSQLAFVRIVDINVGGSNIQAFQFAGNKKLVEGDASADITIVSYYEKDTGILVHTLISGTIVAPEIGNVKLDFVKKGTKLSIPTTLTISSIPSEIQQNQDVSVSGTISPPVNEGQVVLTYKKNDASDEPIKRTVAVTNGAFSDSYKMEKDGTYAVSAEYLGSEAYLSSTTDAATTLTVTPSGCLIATAAFGSELTPQVQFLRNFRDNHILSTAAGSSFMNVFNAWYYSFSPSVAGYEREQLWLQQTVKTAIYPLLGILTVSEKAYALMPGEYGAITAGVIASSMIGAVYISPAAFVLQRFNRHGKIMSNNLTIVLIGLAVVAAIISLLASNQAALMMTTSFLVVTVVAISALFSTRLIRYAINRIKR